jgi:predicted N-acyltransferase
VPRLVVAREGRRLVGAVPLYLKTNSYGEFIFDWGWANAAHRAGVRYYPKLVAAIPFTPVTGRRLPIDASLSDADAAAVTTAMLRAIRELADEERASSIHFLFCTDAEKNALAAAEYLPRLSMQFHWRNRAERPFESFDEFLATFRSRNRKQVRKERQTAAAHGLTFRTATGAELDDRDWEALHAFYLANIARHGGIPYLNERFFRVARDTLADRLVATLAYRGTEPVAGTINFEKGAHLYGRYWGCDRSALHAVRGGRPGRAQAEARPRPGVHAQRALDPRPGPGRRDRRVHRTRGDRGRRGIAHLRTACAVSLGRRRRRRQRPRRRHRRVIIIRRR